jgi:hypothetical protein
VIAATVDGGLAWDSGRTLWLNDSSPVAAMAPPGTPASIGIAGPGAGAAAAGAIQATNTIGGGYLVTPALQAQWYAGAVPLQINNNASSSSNSSWPVLAPLSSAVEAAAAANGGAANVILGATGDGGACQTAAAYTTIALPPWIPYPGPFPSSLSGAVANASAPCMLAVVRVTGLMAGQSYRFRAAVASAAGSSDVAVSPASAYGVLNMSVPWPVDPALPSLSAGIPYAADPCAPPVPPPGLPDATWLAPAANANLTWPPRAGPSAPSAVMHTAPAASAPGPVQGLRIDSMDAQSLTLSWLPPLDAGGNAPLCYRVETAVDGAQGIAGKHWLPMTLLCSFTLLGVLESKPFILLSLVQARMRVIPC